MPFEQRAQDSAVAAAEVDHRLVSPPLEAGETFRASLLAARHRGVERRSLLRVLREPGPEIGLEAARERSFVRARIELGESLGEDAAEEMRELRPRARRATAKQLRSVGVTEHAGLVFCENSVARKRAQDAVERVAIGTDLQRELGNRARSACEGVGDAEVRRDAQRLRHHRAPHEVPEARLGRQLGHRRAASTQAAASSASASVSVRQSSSVRPSRTTAITGGSPARSLPASASSTAHA